MEYMMKLSDFDYKLPPELIAQYPCEKRDESKLLVLHRHTGKIEHLIFKDLPGLLNKEDLLVLNDTKVFKARIIGKRQGFEGRIEILVSHRVRENIYSVLAKPSRKISTGTKMVFADQRLSAEVVGRDGDYIQMRFNANGSLYSLLDEIGSVPLPPYIKRHPDVQDVLRYQTVYAKNTGAIAAPTAGLHFTEDVIRRVREKGIATAYITLHVGYGTFKPVVEEDITKHAMHKEYYEINDMAGAILKKVKPCKGKIIAVGTTVCRALESMAATQSIKGYTDIFIHPGHTFKMVDMLLTNFHLPRTTLIMLVSAFAGRDSIMKAYEEAIRLKYRFFSYGDAMLIV
jgi:S-adenosylmethionine:tRNA ribosyltransferase-isomerase